MKKSMKFVGLVTTAIVAPALFAAPAMAQKANKEAVYSRATTAAPAVQSKVAAMASGQLSRRAADTLDRLLIWNEIMLDANALDHTPSSGFAGDQQGPTRNSRAFAMVSIAVFDAVNSFDRKFKAYNNIGRAPAGASKDAAIAYAAHRTLSVLYPLQAVRLNQLLSADVSTINASAASVAAGRVIGLAAANAMINSRINVALPGAPAIDGADAGEPSFGAGAAPGTAGGVVAGGSTVGFLGKINAGNTAAPNWTPDPVGLARGVALGARWGNVTPFVLRRGDQFRIAPPPAPNTARFRAAFNEVRADGASADTPGSNTSLAKQFIGNFWGYDGASLLGTPPRLYNQVAIKVANDQGLTNVVNYARYLALINTVMGDSGIAAWDSKYFYNYWRPVTGIRSANDGDAATVTVPNWKPFGASVINAAVSEQFTPPFPAYPSGHATFGGSLFEAMRSYFPNNTRFTFVSDEYNGLGVDPKGDARPFVPVRYRTLLEAQQENGKSRIFNGVHWEYDDTEGQALGVNITRFTLNNAFQRR